MMNNFEKTMEEAKRHLLSQNHIYIAQMIGNRVGYMAEIMSNDRTYYEKIRVHEEGEFITLSLSPGISVDKPYMGMFWEYASEINSKHKCGNIRMEQNGSVFIQMEAFFHDGAISEETFKQIEMFLFAILFEQEKNLDRVAHGHLPVEEETARDVIEGILKNRQEAESEMLSRMLEGGIDMEEDDSEEVDFTEDEEDTISMESFVTSLLETGDEDDEDEED